MKRWLLIPVALFTLVAVVPAEGKGLFRGKKKSCDNSSSSDCGQVIVGYETKKQEVTVAEWVTETRKVNVTEYHMVPEKRTITRHKCEQVNETRPVTFTVYEKFKEARTEDYYECVRVEKPMSGTRKVAKHVTKTEPRTCTKDHGHWETQCVEVACSSSSRKGLFCKKKSCDDDCAPKTKLVTKKVWVSKPVTETVNVTFTVCEWIDEKYDYVAVSYDKVKKSRTFDVWVCKPVTKTENRTYVSYKTVAVNEEITVNVCKPSTVEKSVSVQVCKHVKKIVDVKVPVYGTVAAAAPAPCAAPECAPASSCGKSRRSRCCK